MTIYIIGVALITQYTHVHNKNSNTHSKDLTLCGESDFPYHKELLLKERIRPLWEQILSFKRSSNLKMDIIVENQCLIQ